MVKRYVKEPGSSHVRSLYLKAYSGDLTLSFSLWNVGEVLGALAQAARLRRLSEASYREARSRFLLETRRMVKLGIALAVPLRLAVLREGWRIIEAKGLYEADALQIASAKYIKAERLATGDRRLFEAALEEGLEGIYVG